MTDQKDRDGAFFGNADQRAGNSPYLSHASRTAIELIRLQRLDRVNNDEGRVRCFDVAKRRGQRCLIGKEKLRVKCADTFRAASNLRGGFFPRDVEDRGRTGAGRGNF